MAFRTCCCWTALCVGAILLSDISADLSVRYVVHRKASTFSEANSLCSPGVLTTLATQQEVSEVLAAITSSSLPPGDFVFWIGLKKERKECVVPSQPLRGFRWIQDGSQETQVSQWTEEPQRTCTTVRCAALKGNFSGLYVTTWGLIPISCKYSSPFICKVQNQKTPGLLEKPEISVKPATSLPKLEITEPQVITQTPEPTTSEMEPETLRPSTPTSTVTVPATSQPERPAPEVEQTKVYPEHELSPSPSSEPGPGSNPCHNPVIPGARSLSLDPEDNSKIRVECWSSIQLDLSCLGQPAIWRTLDNLPANFSSLCQPCSTGFLKNASGHCEDVDECRIGKPCRHTCVNTEGSFQCVCEDENHPNDGTSPCDDTLVVENANALSSVLIPVLIAVAVLVVLVVVIVVLVKCCLLRRSKKHAMKKAEKMGGLTSDETAIEKATI